MSENDNKEQLTNPNENSEGKSKNKIFGMAKGKVSEIKDFISEKNAERKLEKSIENAFKSNCEKYFDIANSSLLHQQTFYAVPNVESDILIFFKNEKLKVGMTLVNTKTNAKITVLNFQDYSFEFNFNDSTYPVECMKVKYEMYKAPVAPMQQTINHTEIKNDSHQEVTVSGDNHAAITQTNNQVNEALENIQNGLSNIKRNVFNSKKIDNAQKLFGQFEKCVTSNQKDESVFKNFADIIKDLAPVLLAPVESIIKNFK